MSAFAIEHSRLLLALGLFVAAAVLGLLVSRVLMRRVARLSAGTRWALDGALLTSLGRPLALAITAAGGHAALRYYELPGRWEKYADNALLVLLVGALTFFLADLSVQLLQISTRALNKTTAPMTGVVLNVVRVIVFALGVLVLLSSLGVSVAPVLTTVGVGGVAVALGLQDTLKNVFAGVHLTLAGNLRVGDFVRLETGDEGYIDNIQWREARIRTTGGNSVFIPNSRLVESVVTNYHQPSKDSPVLVEVGVEYGADLARVERLTLEVAQSVLQSAPGAVAQFQPLVRFHGFAEQGVKFTVVLRAVEFNEAGLVKHEFVKALSQRFAAEQIAIVMSPRDPLRR